MSTVRHTHSLRPLTTIVLGLLLLLPTLGQAKNSITAELSTLPNVPAPTNRSKPAHVVVNLEAKEYVGTLADGVPYKFWGFNGTVPGPMMRVRVGDTVELHLKNHKSSQFPHNMDLHAVNGPGGGAGANLASPGQEGVFSFKALNPGLYMYHCASPVPNIPAHIANGMYGMILVEPEEGLPKVDHEFAIVESEFFTMPSKEKGTFELSMEKGLAEHPDHVVFNGKAGILTGDGELKVKAGETVRLYFGNIGPNGTSSFHVIGEIFDTVYVDGAIGGTLNHNVQTTMVPSAGAVIVEFKVDVPGSYLLVDHSIFRVAKGAVGILTATGDENPSIFNPHNPQ
ncbi:MAG: copper-containing nitrite reductase [Nitrospirales bacterium]